MNLETALRETCHLETPSALVNEAFRYAKDNMARCMRYYTLGWGMSNAPHYYSIVVGRDTGWMCMGTDYVAEWFASPAFAIFRDRQCENGKIIEYVEMETGRQDDYGLNVADNSPLYIWGVAHHIKQFNDTKFAADFLESIHKAAQFLISQVGPRGLIVTIPNGVEMQGISSWRNLIKNYVLAGEVTELNCLAVKALREAADVTGETRYAEAAGRISNAINENLWRNDTYLLTSQDGIDNPSVTCDLVFPVLCGVAPRDRAVKVLDRLRQPDFWHPMGLRTVPQGDPGYDPSGSWGLIGGVWPNPTLWYAAAVAPYDADEALRALEVVARPVLEPDNASGLNTRNGEFAEWFDGETGVNSGMHLSPWVAPTFVWAVMEGLLGLRWENGAGKFNPFWPSGWQSVTIKNLPQKARLDTINLRS